MNEDLTSLDRLHDIVEPPPVPWWPPAPGWYFVLAVAALALAWMLLQCWRHWRANAYRRAALRELKTTQSAPAIAELLKRTALAVAPRSTIASLTGEQWPQWLADNGPDTMPKQVSDQLASCIYQTAGNADIDSLREYARHWIEGHTRTNGTSS